MCEPAVPKRRWAWKHIREADGGLTCRYKTLWASQAGVPGEPVTCERCGRPERPSMRREEWRELRAWVWRRQTKQARVLARRVAEQKARLRRWRLRWTRGLTQVQPPRA